jgi:hypothetical protein
VNDRIQAPSADGKIRAKLSMSVDRVVTDSKLPKISGYLQRERVKRFADVTKKMTWDTIQRMDPAEMEGATNQADFDPKEVLGVQSREDQQFIKQVFGHSRGPSADKQSAQKVGGHRSVSYDTHEQRIPVYKWSSTSSKPSSVQQKARK